jgi:hypothetical protein
MKPYPSPRKPSVHRHYSKMMKHLKGNEETSPPNPLYHCANP